MSGKAVTTRITGHVQGVAFRVWAQREAEQRGLAGWVRNEPDGSVLALIAGPEERIANMLEALRKGPPAASVDAVQVAHADADPAMTGFRITR